MSAVAVPAGRYFLGDPCYAVPDHKWHELLNSCDYFATPVGKFDTHEVVAFDTEYGDGVYVDQYGNSFSVDSGMIGLTPMSAADETEEHLSRLGHIVEFDDYTLCSEKAGVLQFGHYVIDTGDEEDAEGV